MSLYKKAWLFLKIMRVYLPTRYWLSRCNNPIKLAILQLCEAGCIMSFSAIGWWIPKAYEAKVEA